jgi:serine phosphatase RsbU (regulator of sigma subunit)
MVGDLLDAELAPVHDGTIAVGIRHVVCVPLVVVPINSGEAGATPHQAIGVLYLDGRERARMLSSATQNTLEAFAMQAAMAIESARLYAEAAEKATIDRDLRVAADIQRALLPEPAYDGPLAELTASTVPCRTIGGDFFDYLELPDRGLAFVLGDVAGKGPPAALLAATLQSHFVAHAQLVGDPADTVSRINRALLRRAIEARFATMFYGVVSGDGVLRYCNAGQEPPALVRPSGVEWLEIGGPVVGLLDIATYDTGTVPLADGDIIVVCSDGVTEARSVTGEEFGRERLAAAIVGVHGLGSDLVLDRITAAVRVFAHGAAQSDDITALVLRYKGSR